MSGKEDGPNACFNLLLLEHLLFVHVCFKMPLILVASREEIFDEI